jgi:hypothetical protein
MEPSDQMPGVIFRFDGIATAQSWGAAKMRSIYDEASQFEPGGYCYAQILADYLLPKWNGEKGNTEKFAEEAADRVGGEEGDILYFRLAAYLVCACEDETHLSWPRIKKGFELSERRYGASMLSLNKIAFLASHYDGLDSIAAEKAFSRIGEQWDQATWTTKDEFDRWKNWAAAESASNAKQKAIDEAAEANASTPEGTKYKVVFEKKYKKSLEECVRSEGLEPINKFKAFTRIGPNGTVEEITVEEMRIFGNGPAAVYMYGKLREFQKENATAFSRPPYSPYWIRLDLDAAEFAPGPSSFKEY